MPPHLLQEEENHFQGEEAWLLCECFQHPPTQHESDNSGIAHKFRGFTLAYTLRCFKEVGSDDVQFGLDGQAFVEVNFHAATFRRITALLGHGLIRLLKAPFLIIIILT